MSGGFYFVHILQHLKFFDPAVLKIPSLAVCRRGVYNAHILKYAETAHKRPLGPVI